MARSGVVIVASFVRIIPAALMPRFDRADNIPLRDFRALLEDRPYRPSAARPMRGSNSAGKSDSTRICQAKRVNLPHLYQAVRPVESSCGHYPAAIRPNDEGVIIPRYDAINPRTYRFTRP